MTDLIKRDDALRIVEEYDVLHDHIKALPTIDPAAIRETALREAAALCDLYPYVEGVKTALIDLIGKKE